MPGHLDIVVLPKFIQQHSDVVDVALSCPLKNINFVAITSEDETVLKSRKSGINRALRAFQEWHLLSKYATTLGCVAKILYPLYSILPQKFYKLAYYIWCASNFLQHNP